MEGGLDVFITPYTLEAAGYNLQAGSRITLLEMTTDPSEEEQSIGRVWRQGNANRGGIVPYRLSNDDNALEKAASQVRQGRHELAVKTWDGGSLCNQNSIHI